MLASRLQRVIGDIVGPDQTAYITGRFIGSNVRLIQDVFDLYNKKNISGLFMFIDFEKAFDSVEWNFMFSTLSKFNLGCDFQKWVRLLYIEPRACVKNNGYFSQEFSLSRGVRQGCQVSCLIFILCMEVMSSYIRQNTKIKGLSLDENRSKNIKIIQYADDATLFLKTAQEMREAISSLEEFRKVAGTKLNISKCKGLWIGSSKNRQNSCTLCSIKWPVKPIRYLGIYIGYDTQTCYNLNYEDKIRQIDEVLAQASKRNLTLFGKVCIIKSLALSKIIYVSLCLNIPDSVITEIDQKIFRFLWGKRDRIKRKSVINKLEKGGLNMLDLRSQICAIKAAWASRIMSAPDDHLWSFLPKFYFSNFGEDFLILKTTFNDKSMITYLRTLPEFYQEVITCYNRSKIIEYEDFCKVILNQPIWGNRFLKFKNKTLFFKSWIAEGIHAVKNLKIRNGVIDVTYLNDIVKDKRNFHIEINILNAAFKAANIRISNDPVIDTRIPIYIHHCDEIHNWTCKRSKYYYDHIVEQVLVRPSSEQYWDSVSGQRITEHFLYKSYFCKVKQIKDKKLAETNFKILNNILPCNANLHKWGKSDTKLCCFRQEDETVSHLLFECVYIC